VTDTYAPPLTNGPAPRITPGDAQMVALRRGVRAVSLWLAKDAGQGYVLGRGTGGNAAGVLQHGPEYPEAAKL
jgi:hypothetical protein